MKNLFKIILSAVCAIQFASALANASHETKTTDHESKIQTTIDQLVLGAKNQIGKTLYYKPAYQVIPYPGGDIPIVNGVCTDVIVRAFRAIGIDLQKHIHEDMKKNWKDYPKKWGLKGPDTNIDHRRVPNLVRFFKKMDMLCTESDFLPGDIVVWDLGGGVLHIGILSDVMQDKDPLVIHNICCGVKQEDVLRSHKILYKFRLTPEAVKKWG